MERFREASAKPPRSLREATAVQLPRSAPLGPAMPPSPEAPFFYRLHRPLSHGLNIVQLHESANVRDVCETSTREARRSHSAKPQSCREASRSQPFHEIWPREARRVASQQCIRSEPLKKTMLNWDPLGFSL